MKNKKAFSIIEIVIATWILTITAFWIYRLIWENNKIVINSNNFLAQNIVLENSIECLKWKNFENKKFLDFWDDLKSCNIWNQEKIVKIDWIEYIISIETIEENWKIKIESSSAWILEKEIKK